MKWHLAASLQEVEFQEGTVSWKSNWDKKGTTPLYFFPGGTAVKSEHCTEALTSANACLH
jgi:hypothetical protein